MLDSITVPLVNNIDSKLYVNLKVQLDFSQVQRNLCTICMNLTYNVANMILKHKIMVNLKFDIEIACYFGYSMTVTFMIDLETNVIVLG